MIERIPYPEALPVSTQDYVRQNNLIETGFLRVNDPWPVVGGNIAKGSVFQVGGTVYLATSDTAIVGGASDYVKLTPSGDGSTLAPTYVANLAGVSWNQTYNGYYAGGNLYVFDELLAYLLGQIASLKSFYGKNSQNSALYVDSVGASSVIRKNQKIMETGDWNMDTTASIVKAHGLVLAKILEIRVTIIRDDGVRSSFPVPISTLTTNERILYDAVNITIVRGANGIFDSVDYNATPFNRGLIIIDYEI